MFCPYIDNNNYDSDLNLCLYSSIYWCLSLYWFLIIRFDWLSAFFIVVCIYLRYCLYDCLSCLFMILGNCIIELISLFTLLLAYSICILVCLSLSMSGYRISIYSFLFSHLFLICCRVISCGKLVSLLWVDLYHPSRTHTYRLSTSMYF